MRNIHGPSCAAFRWHRDHNISIAPLNPLLDLRLYQRRARGRGSALHRVIHVVDLPNIQLSDLSGEADSSRDPGAKVWVLQRHWEEPATF